MAAKKIDEAKQWKSLYRRAMKVVASQRALIKRQQVLIKRCTASMNKAAKAMRK